MRAVKARFHKAQVSALVRLVTPELLRLMPAFPAARRAFLDTTVSVPRHPVLRALLACFNRFMGAPRALRAEPVNTIQRQAHQVA